MPIALKSRPSNQGPAGTRALCGEPKANKDAQKCAKIMRNPMIP